jgi:hypothetical protein
MATAFNISTFRAKLGDGGARPNQFQVSFSMPNPGIGAAGTASNKLEETSTYLVSVAELPGQTIGVAPVYYRGREIKLAGDKTFAPFTCTILNDSSFTLRSALEGWMEMIEGNRTKIGVVFPSLYCGTIEVTQLDRNGLALRKYIINDAWPVDISPIGLDFAANDQLSTFSATFQYLDFSISGITSLAAATQNAINDVVGTLRAR